MAGGFECRRWDGAGRLGQLAVPGYDEPIHTPTLLPVINPNRTALPATAIVEEFDPEALITNAYVIYQSEHLRKVAEAEGVHGLLGVDLPVMTDSGSFQLAAYGSIDVDNEEILAFQRSIGSTIVTPVDLPTPPDATVETA
ncbi:MAG: tRNA-guanine transglycosylase, partial [Halobacteriota archaeon]